LLLVVRASRSLLLCWWIWCGMLALTLVSGSGLPAVVRLGMLLPLACLAWCGHCQIWRDPAGVRQLGWNADGRWWLLDGRGFHGEIAWLPPLRQLGPWLWACFRVAGHKQWVLVDVRITEPGALSALKVRATLLRR
jgi:hypothetical protein